MIVHLDPSPHHARRWLAADGRSGDTAEAPAVSALATAAFVVEDVVRAVT